MDYESLYSTATKALNSQVEENDKLKAELKKKDELLFAYESVKAPVNPLLAENKRLLKCENDLRKIHEEQYQAVKNADMCYRYINKVLMLVSKP